MRAFVVLGLVFHTKLVWKITKPVEIGLGNISEMTNFVSSGT